MAHAMLKSYVHVYARRNNDTSRNLRISSVSLLVSAVIDPITIKWFIVLRFSRFYRDAIIALIKLYIYI